MKKNLLLLTLFLLAFSAGAQSYWEKLKVPYGGEVKVTQANDGTLYSQALGAGMYEDNLGKVFRSKDSGNTWETLQIPTSFGSSVAKTVIGPSRNFYILNKEIDNHYYLYKSTDEGQTWETKVRTFEYQYFVFEARSGALFRSSGDQLKRSMDGGNSWTTVLNNTSNDALNKMVQMPNGDLVVYLFGYKQWYWSKDDGTSWKYLPQAPSSEAVNVFFTLQGTWLCYDSNKNMYRSADNGITWSKTTFTKTSFVNSMCLLPSGRVLFGRQLDESFYSDDNGLTWKLLGSSVSHFVLPGALPNGDILAVRHSSLYRSSNGGATWHFSSEGINLGDVRAMKFESEDTLFAVTSAGVWRTFNAGTQWSQVVRKKDVPGLNKHKPYAAYWFDKGAGGRLAAFNGDSLLLSSDWGDHFSRIVSPDKTLNNTHNPKVKVSPDGFTLYVHGNGLYCSNDWGITWKKLLAQEVQSFEIHPSGRLLAVRNYNQLWYSDNGSDWSQTSLPTLGGQITSLFCTIVGEIIAEYNLPNGGGFRFVRSSDAGMTWSVQSGAFCPYYLIDNSAGHLFGIAGASKPYRSLDEGVQWQTMPDLKGAFYSWAISPKQYLYVATDGVSLYRSRRPTTEGAYLEGNVLLDADADCTTPDGQPSSRAWSVKAEGPDIWYANSDSTGRYRMFIDTGTYEVSVRSPHPLWWSICESPQTASLQQLFDADTVEFSAAALLDCPLMQVDVAAPRFRRCFDNPVYVEYCNIGSETADSAWVEIELDPYLSMVSAQLPYNSLGPKRFRFNMGTVQPGVCEQFHFTVHVDCDSTVLGQTHCILAHAWPDTLCAPVNGWSGANIEAEAHCIGDTTVQLILRNTGTGISQTLEYIIIEDLVVLDMGDKVYDPGEELVINLPAQGRTWRIESQQEPGHPFSNLAIAFTEGCNGFNSLGFINQFGTNTVRPAWDRFCLENTGSYDPNDKQGFPLGQGPDRRIRPGQDLEYLIRFQNTGTDTAFTVIIRDTLSAWLDAASVRPGAASHPYTWTLSGQGVLTFRFNNILLPDSTTNLEGSQGFVSFRVEQQPEVPLGTKILNEAAIYFDFNAPVITNQTLHTVGLDLKSSTGDLPVAGPSDAVLISPNPVAETAVFHLREGAFQRHRLTLTDALGRTVQQCPLTGSQYIFDRKSLPSGVYGYRVDDAQGRLTGSGKVVLR